MARSRRGFLCLVPPHSLGSGRCRRHRRDGAVRPEAAGRGRSGLFGGAFALQTTGGQPSPRRTCTGKPSLVFFGYTYLPRRLPDDAGRSARLAGSAETTPEQLRIHLRHRRSRARHAGRPAHLSRRFLARFHRPRSATRPVPRRPRRPSASISEKVQTDANTVLSRQPHRERLPLRRDGRFEGTIAYGEDTESALAKISRLLGT